MRYRIRSGDTIGDLAQSFGVSEDEIRSANGSWVDDHFDVGKQLTIPQDSYDLRKVASELPVEEKQRLVHETFERLEEPEIRDVVEEFMTINPAESAEEAKAMMSIMVIRTFAIAFLLAFLGLMLVIAFRPDQTETMTTVVTTIGGTLAGFVGGQFAGGR